MVHSPAGALLNLKDNEGGSHDKDVALCFAGKVLPTCFRHPMILIYAEAPSYFRHLSETINELPSQFDEKLDILIDYKDSETVARNIAILILAFEYLVDYLWPAGFLVEDCVNTSVGIYFRFSAM